MAAFYIVSEALTNTAKHAHATVVHVDVETKDVMPGSPSATTASGVRISIGDRGSGLVGLTDRVEALSGRIEITSPSGGGASLRVTILIQRV